MYDESRSPSRTSLILLSGGSRQWPPPRAFGVFRCLFLQENLSHVTSYGYIRSETGMHWDALGRADVSCHATAFSNTTYVLASCCLETPCVPAQQTKDVVFVRARRHLKLTGLRLACCGAVKPSSCCRARRAVVGRPSHTGDTQQTAPEKVPSSAPSSAGACLSAGITLYGRWLHTVCPRWTLPLHTEGPASLTAHFSSS